MIMVLFITGRNKDHRLARAFAHQSGLELTPLRKLALDFSDRTGVLIPAWIELQIDAGNAVNIAWQFGICHADRSGSVCLHHMSEFSYLQKDEVLIMALFLMSVALGNVFVAAVGSSSGTMGHPNSPVRITTSLPAACSLPLCCSFQWRMYKGAYIQDEALQSKRVPARRRRPFHFPSDDRRGVSNLDQSAHVAWCIASPWSNHGGIMTHSIHPTLALIDSNIQELQQLILEFEALAFPTEEPTQVAPCCQPIRLKMRAGKGYDDLAKQINRRMQDHPDWQTYPNATPPANGRTTLYETTPTLSAVNLSRTPLGDDPVS